MINRILPAKEEQWSSFRPCFDLMKESEYK